MAQYNAHYVHKISPKEIPEDSEGPFEISDNAFSNRRTLAKAMRQHGMLHKGLQLRNFRVEGDKVVTFPRESIWHAIVLEPADNYEPAGIDYPRVRPLRSQWKVR